MYVHTNLQKTAFLKIRKEKYRCLRKKIQEVEQATGSDLFDAAFGGPVIETILSIGGLYGSIKLSLSDKDTVVQMLVRTVNIQQLEPCFRQLGVGLETQVQGFIKEIHICGLNSSAANQPFSVHL